MKYAILTIALLGNTISLFSQTEKSELPQNKTPLIYHDTIISRLKQIVDSLHSSYRRIDLKKTFYSVPQTKGYYVGLSKGNFKNALKDIQDNISLEEFRKKYPQSTVYPNLLIALTRQTYDSVPKLVYLPHAGDGAYFRSITIDADKADKVEESKYGPVGRTANWVYEYEAGSEYTQPGIMAFFMETPLKTIALPERYASRIMYADCMIDTTTEVFLPTAKNDIPFYWGKAGPKFKAFEAYIKNNTGDSAFDMYIWWEECDIDTCIQRQLSLEPRFRILFTDAVIEALKFEYITGEWFEYYTDKYYSKKAALALKRNRFVINNCGNGYSHQSHILEIAKLAAALGDWQIFLRAHLRIIDDRIEHSIDNSYMLVRHNNYIKELEALEINLQDLLPAICFTISNPAANHYSGDVNSLAGVFAEVKDRNQFEQTVLTIIADNELDDLNRLRMHKLFLNYIYFLPTKELRSAALQKLQNADEKLPYYLYSGLGINKEELMSGPRN